MHRNDRIAIRDPRSSAILASRWSLANAETQMEAARACLAAMPEASGLVRYSLFRGVDDATLFHLAQWDSEAARDHYIHVLSAQPNAAVDAKVARLLRDWREAAVPHRSFSSSLSETAKCLVVMRQPMVRPDAALARGWADSVMAALESPDGAPTGLCAVSFLVSKGGDIVLNLAEWTSADTHQAALRQAGFAKHGSIGQSPEWRAARSRPGVTAAHEVRRYALFAAPEPGA